MILLACVRQLLAVVEEKTHNVYVTIAYRYLYSHSNLQQIALNDLILFGEELRHIPWTGDVTKRYWVSI